MMSSVVISIIIPTFRRDEFLKKTLSSLVKQTFSNLEVLVCDDGGNMDTTKNITNSFSKYFPIRYLNNYNSTGRFNPAAARNMGAQDANGEYLMFLDCDIILPPDAIELMYSWLSKFKRYNKYHVTVDKRVHVTNDVDSEMIINRYSEIPKSLIKGFSKKYDGVSLSGGGMIKKDVYEKIGGFDTVLFDGLRGEDLELMYRLEAFLNHKTKKLPITVFHLDNRQIKGERREVSGRTDSISRDVTKKKYQELGFKFVGKRPQKDLEIHNEEFYKNILLDKDTLDRLSTKLNKEALSLINSSTEVLEKEYSIENSQQIAPLVYILVLNFNGLKWIDICLPSILETNYKNFEVLFIDNNSSDKSAEKVKEEYPEVEILELDKNYGYAGGNNKGIRHALKNDAEYIAVLNNDVTVHPDWLHGLVKFGENNFDAGAMGPLILNSKGNKVQGPMYGFNKPSYVDLDNAGNNRRVGKLVGCAILFKRKALEKVGLFDKSFFCYQEEYDWCQRALFHNFNLYQIPSSTINHYGFQTSARKKNILYYRMRYLFTRNEIKRHLKDPNKPMRKLIKFVVFKKYKTLPRSYRNFFLYHTSLIHNLFLLPKTAYRRNLDIKGY